MASERAFARLRPVATVDAAQRDAKRLGTDLRATYGESVATPEVRSLSDDLVGPVRRELWLLMSAVMLLLLIAVANVGSLMLAAGEQRQPELALRSALGARGVDLVKLLLGEALALGVAGGTLGVALAYVGVGATAR